MVAECQFQLSLTMPVHRVCLARSGPGGHVVCSGPCWAGPFGSFHRAYIIKCYQRKRAPRSACAAVRAHLRLEPGVFLGPVGTIIHQKVPL